ncbi:hypothetical protein CASFOL_020790 [Castilleja foliolosa]|uniref:Uncharacterized protein n=1 Tax=Castilleja foliolosa TaxID=1961234 RepID=A0ABD3D2L5_9LAMI
MFFWAQSNYAQIPVYYKVAHQLFDCLPKLMFDFSNNCWAFVYSLIIKILVFIYKYMYRSKYGVIEEKGSNFSANRSQKDNKVISNNSKTVLSSGVAEKENSDEDIAKTEDSVFISTKCQSISSKDVIRYLEEPKIEKLSVREMFVGSSEVLFSSDQQNLEKKSVQFDEEPNCLSFRFNLYKRIPETEDIISISNQETDAYNKEEVFEEIEKLSSMGSNDFSYQVEFFPFTQFSTVDENQESGYGKDEKIDLIDETLNFEGFSDDEYLEFEPRCDSLTLIITKDEGLKEQNISGEGENFLNFDSDSFSNSDKEDVLWEHQSLVRQMKTELKNCRIGGLPTISEECESSKIVSDLKPLKIDHKIEYKDVMDEIQKFHKSYSEKMRKLDILNYQTLHAISFLQLKDSEVFTSDDCLKANKKIREERDGIPLEFLVGIIRESMMIFRDFVFADKKAINVVVNGSHGTKIDLQESQKSELLVDIISNLQKKDRKIREHVKSRNCIVKKLKKYQSSRSGDDDIELLTSHTDLRLISRVLSMSRLTMYQLVWCQDKLNNISFVSRKVYVEPSFLLFPC